MAETEVLTQLADSPARSAPERASLVRVKLVRSPIGTTERVRQTLKGLGLGKVGSSRTLQRTAAIVGMIRRVPHLVSEVPLNETADKN
jgi:large subunit ribosomal protein L30